MERYEKTNLSELGEIQVKRTFTELGVDFDWEKNPEILRRLIETGEHFQDAADIANIIDRAREKQNIGLDQKEMLLAALLHDIGKSGPANADENTRAAIKKLFIHKTARTSPNLSIAEFLQTENFPDRETLLNILSEKLNIDPTREKMIEFWRRHADWTWDILQNNLSEKITPEVATVAASHHILDKKNPAGLDINNIPADAKFLEITDKYVLLTLVDKYQAFRERSGLSHEQAINIIKGMIEKSDLPQNIQQKYQEILEKINISASTSSPYREKLSA